MKEDEPQRCTSREIKNPRYFLRYYERNVLKCGLCDEGGHLGSQCRLSLDKCIFCGSSYHGFQKCPEMTCNLCGLPGHLWRNCSGGNKCSECGSAGHSAEGCIASKKPCGKKVVMKIRCLFCKKNGHANCRDSKGIETLSKQTCSRCGIQGHNEGLCPNKKRSDKLSLFREHVREAMVEFPDISGFMNCKERRYWEKVGKKAYKKLMKMQKLKKKKKSKTKKSQ